MRPALSLFAMIAIKCLITCDAMAARGADAKNYWQPLFDPTDPNPTIAQVALDSQLRGAKRQILGHCQAIWLGADTEIDLSQLNLRAIEYCRGQTPLSKSSDSSVPWPARARRTGQLLAFAALMAHESFCKARDCPKDSKNLVLLLTDAPFVGAYSIGSESSAFLIEFPKGITLGIADSVDAAMLEDMRSINPRAFPEAMSYSQWLEKLRHGHFAGDDPMPRPGILAGYDYDRTKIENQLPNGVFISMGLITNKIYQFILMHEYAHLVGAEGCGSGSLDPAKVEPACDKVAFATLQGEDGQSFYAGPLFNLIHWMVGQYFLDQFLARQIEKNQDSKEMPAENKKYAGQARFFRAFPGRMWIDRADQILAAAEESAHKYDGRWVFPLSQDEVNREFSTLHTLIRNARSWAAEDQTLTP